MHSTVANMNAVLCMFMSRWACCRADPHFVIVFGGGWKETKLKLSLSAVYYCMVGYTAFLFLSINIIGGCGHIVLNGWNETLLELVNRCIKYLALESAMLCE